MRRILGSGVWLAGLLPIAASLALVLASQASAAGSAGQSQSLQSRRSKPWTSSLQDRPDECPPCFDCHLPRFTCLNSGKCNEYDGQCLCAPGFGGLDCGLPLDGSLPDGKERYPREGNHPTCKDGWTGLTCNVCETNKACKAMVPDDGDSTIRPSYIALLADNDKDKEEDTAVCYTGGFAVKQVHQMCDVTNRKILDMLPGRPPQVTFSCNRQDSTCSFQFWVGGIESFYCGLDECSVSGEATQSGNVTNYACQKIACQCIPERMLCGEAGSVNIDDFLSEEIKGPGSFSCKTDGSGCIFTEPAMNQLINDIFGDSYITLNCQSGECLHYSMVPGFEAPTAPNNSKLVAASIAVTGLSVLIACLAFWYLGRVRKHDFGSIRLPGDSNGNGHDAAEVDRLMSNHLSGSLSFENLSYITPNGKQVLSGVSGNVQSGQLMAIMGASGAGKSTFLDILAQKTKRGTVSGEILVNGRSMTRDKYKRIVGFVDQDDTLMSTLTVYETILYSALLRLPRDMSMDAKKIRTLETMQELGILGIKDSRIGESGKRSISGGEKRRVSIACELVTSPSIIFLDEPTSGLDAFNAINVVECLVNLAKDYNRTVVFTIHQPRSNIVTLFDKLVLLAGGKAVYSGGYEKCQDYFEGIGHPCPPGFNIADFLIDLTMQDERSYTSDLSTLDQNDDEESGPTSARSRASTFASDTELQSRKSGNASSLRKKLGFTSPTSPVVLATLSPHLTRLVGAYEESRIATVVKEFHDDAKNNPSDAGTDLDKIASFKQASWWTQFCILSGRAFKNLYRNPMLMLAHYVVSIVVALLCSFLFANVTNDIPGFQNRMGLFFFVLALFGFSCLTSLEVFAKERILFMRERSNGYYSPFTYFAAKVLFDVLPLRVIPPFILGSIIYHPVGLVPAVAQFWKFILVLIMFNMSASSIVFFLSIVISNSGVANLVGSLVMLFNLLFAGLLVNRDKVPLGVGWLQTISFFHAAFEGLLVNEVRYLQLKDHKYGVDIEVPAATILSMFGFRAQAFWWPDFAVLCIYFAGFMLLSFIALVVLVKERR